jgi:hypothetical protein
MDIKVIIFRYGWKWVEFFLPLGICTPVLRGVINMYPHSEFARLVPRVRRT